MDLVVVHGWKGFVLSMLLILPSLNGGDSETRNVQQSIRDSLSLIGLTEKDLDFKKDVLPDRNLSPLVRTLLGHPLKMFEFTDMLEDQLEKPPWKLQPLKSSNYRCRVESWKGTPEVFRSNIQELLDGLFQSQDWINQYFNRVSENGKMNALRAYALENFHVDRDKTSFNFWASLTGDSKSLQDLVQRADQLQLEETDLIVLQLHSGRKIDPVELSHQTSILLSHIEKFIRKISPVLKSASDQTDFAIIELKTSLGRVVLGGRGSQSYSGDAVLTIDFGGNDHYSKAGCAYGTVSEPISIVIDLDGDDHYDAAASGVWGVGMVWDESGNDRYQCANASLGCGLFGAGVLVDRGGDDHYTGDTLTQGAAAFGYGLLWDGNGNDDYSTALQGQGFAGVNGYGILCDLNGDDRYVAGHKYPDYDRFPERTLSLSQGFSIGYRPYAPGGVGILFDRSGDDHYESDVYGQGASYWYSCGVLIDGAGNDSYKAWQYAQGSGIHLSVGILKDGEGNDSYFCERGLAQGGCHDFAVGLLWEGAGNDVYSSESSSQGSGIHNAVGIHYDGSGNDHYIITDSRNGQGQGSGGYSERRGIGSVGVLVDISGADDYSNVQQNNHVAGRPSIGVAVDVSNRAALEKIRKPWAVGTLIHEPVFDQEKWNQYSSRRKQDPVQHGDLNPFDFGQLITDQTAVVPRTNKEIFEMGGTPEMGHLLRRAGQYGDRPWKIEDRKLAKLQLESIAAAHFRGLLPWLGRGDVMTRVLLDELVEKNHRIILPILREFAESDWHELRSFCLYWIGEKGESQDALLAYQSLKDDRTRPTALLALSKLGGDLRKIRPYLKSKRDLERALAVRILSKAGILDDALFVRMLEDPDWNVREEAVKALQKGGSDAQEAIKQLRPLLGPLGSFWVDKAGGSSLKNPKTR